MSCVLSCSFPTTIVVVDDNRNFVDVLSESINASGVSVIKKFTDPYAALEFINSNSADNRLDASDLIIDGEEGTSDWKSLLLNINCLHKEIYSYDRFKKISVVIVDYSMPGMNGVEFCTKIEDKNIQKVLLTGEADEKIAVNAFNDRSINRYIKKESNNVNEEVSTSIEKAIYQYFRNHTIDLSRHLHSYDKIFFEDPVFANFFCHLCKTKTFSEFYMLDNLGSYLFLTKKGSASALHVITEHEMSKLIEVGIESEEISDYVLHCLRSGEFMIASHNRSGTLPPIAEWDKVIKPAIKLDGYQTYYYSLSNEQALDIDFNDICTLDGFLKL